MKTKKNITISMSPEAIETGKKLAKEDNLSFSRFLEHLIDSNCGSRVNRSLFSEDQTERIKEIFKNSPSAGSLSESTKNSFKDNIHLTTIPDDFNWDDPAYRKMIWLKDLSSEQASKAIKEKKLINSPMGIYVIMTPDGEFE